MGGSGFSLDFACRLPGLFVGPGMQKLIVKFTGELQRSIETDTIQPRGGLPVEKIVCSGVKVTQGNVTSMQGFFVYHQQAVEERSELSLDKTK